jgi:hypothetical protein
MLRRLPTATTFRTIAVSRLILTGIFAYRCSLMTQEETVIMTHTPENEEPGFEADVNERHAGKGNGSDETLEDSPDGEQAAEMEHVQAEAAEERKEGGYQ